MSESDLSGARLGPLLLPTYQSSCKERREERRFFVLNSVCKRACKVLPGHRSKRGEYMPPSFMCSLALPGSTGTGSGRPPYTKTRSAAQAFQPKELALTKKSDLNLSFRILLNIFCRILLTKEALYNVS